ncbi:hypothetical protein J6590_075134 [Homalodisca vitripennis]|nr:hypothetical protein J6590_075134 [Homalodisca vitripennis]
MHEETASPVVFDCGRLKVRRRALFGTSQRGDKFDVRIGRKLLDLIEGLEEDHVTDVPNDMLVPTWLRKWFPCQSLWLRTKNWIFVFGR